MGEMKRFLACLRALQLLFNHTWTFVQFERVYRPISASGHFGSLNTIHPLFLFCQLSQRVHKRKINCTAPILRWKEEIFFKSLKNYIPSELIKLLHSYLLQITKKMKGIFMSPNPGARNNLGKQGNKIHDCSESVQLPQSGKVKFYLMNTETQSCFKQYSGKLLSTGTLWNFLRSPRTKTFCNRKQNNLVTCSVLL